MTKDCLTSAAPATADNAIAIGLRLVLVKWMQQLLKKLLRYWLLLLKRMHFADRQPDQDQTLTDSVWSPVAVWLGLNFVLRLFFSCFFCRFRAVYLSVLMLLLFLRFMRFIATLHWLCISNEAVEGASHPTGAENKFNNNNKTQTKLLIADCWLVLWLLLMMVGIAFAPSYGI